MIVYAVRNSSGEYIGMSASGYYRWGTLTQAEFQDSERDALRLIHSLGLLECRIIKVRIELIELDTNRPEKNSRWDNM